MKTRRGFSLVEMLTYIAVLATVLTLTYPAFYRCVQNSTRLRRNTDDIARALHAGERWRADLREATAAPTLTGNALTIPQATGPVTYEFTDNTVWRHAGSARVAVLRQVQAAAFHADSRRHVTAWRWEVALAPTQKTVRMEPLFTFTAVAGGTR
jgi:prepilin-type N-terminal cleavage/methylation domain-containing protein